MIKLYQFAGLWSLPNASPFCMKMETYLRMANLPYEVVTIHDPRKAPKGKLPFIDDAGKRIADSGLIIEYLKQKYGDSLDAHLSPAQKGISIALQRLFEEHLYWIAVYGRWVEPNNWEMVKKDYFGNLPALLRRFIPDMIRKKFMKAMHGQGVLRHSRDEIYQLGKEDLRAVSEILGSNAFMLGNEPTSIDASAYAFIANILEVPINSPLKDYVRSRSNLIDYCARMKERFY